MNEIQIVHGDRLEVEISSGQMTRLAGVSRTLTGATGIHLALATIPPACASSGHRHTNCESAIYVVSGHGEFLVGDDLRTAMPFGPGDFIYVPPGRPHKPVNTSRSEAVVMVVARNAPVEIVEEYAPGAPRA